MTRNAHGPAATWTSWVIEGVASCGAGLAATAERAGHQVVEAARMDARPPRGGQPDPLDAARIAAVLPLDTSLLRRPRTAEGVPAALRSCSPRVTT